MKRSLKYSVTAVFAIGVAALVLAACGGGGGNATAASSAPGSGLVSVKKVQGKKVLVDSHGKTLYSPSNEKGGMIRCTGACTSFWKPLKTSAGQAKTAAANQHLQLAVVKRPDGGQQLTLKGMPLYTFTPEGPGQLKGDGVTDHFGGTTFHWSAATGSGGSSSGASKSSSEKSEYGSSY